MSINKGYVACHKVSGPQPKSNTSTVYIVECPNCKHNMQLNGDYSENLDNEVICSECKFKASGYNFTYISSTIKGDITDGGK